MVYTERLRPKWVPSQASGQGYEMVGISLVEVYERVGRSVISVSKKRVQKGQQMHFVAVKTFWFCDLFTCILKKVQLQQ